MRSCKGTALAHLWKTAIAGRLMRTASPTTEPLFVCGAVWPSQPESGKGGASLVRCGTQLSVVKSLTGVRRQRKALG